MQKVGIVIVNYRTSALCVSCLASLARAVPRESTGVIVVDNDSADGSADRIAEAIAARGWSDWIELIARPVNDGYAGGNNVAIRKFLDEGEAPAYILLLNPDTLVSEGFLAPLIEALEREDSAGIAGSKLENEDGTVAVSAFRYPSVLGEIESMAGFGILSRLLGFARVAQPPPTSRALVDWLAGACMLIRTTTFQRIGLLDDRYFLYFEEVDFCLRARRHGIRCVYEPASSVVHLVGRSSGISGQNPRARRPAYWFESRQRYFAKNHGPVYAAAADLGWCAGLWIGRIKRRVKGEHEVLPEHFVADFLEHSALLKWMHSRR